MRWKYNIFRYIKVHIYYILYATMVLFHCFSAFKNDVLQNIGLHVFIGPSLANLSLLRLLLLINIVSQAKMSTYLNSSLAFGLHLFLGPCFGLLRISTLMLSQTHEAKNSFRAAIPKVFLWKIQIYYLRLKINCLRFIKGILLAWPITILQNDNITISWDFFQANSTKVSRHGCWCCQSEKISWYRNIIIL